MWFAFQFLNFDLMLEFLFVSLYDMQLLLLPRETRFIKIVEA